jgi:hypothetical protein
MTRLIRCAQGESMKNTIKYTISVSVMLLVAGVPSLLAATSTTYAVGNCKPQLRSFVHIQDALNATPPPTVVQVCPGTHNEQVTITQAVTLEGISSGDSDQAVIAPPTGGLTANAMDDFGDSLAVQLWVDNASGPVNISNLTVDGTGNGVATCAPFIVGVFYQNASGTVNQLTSRNQKGNGCGEGVRFEGGTSNPSVTIENSSIHDFDNTGILTETNSGPSELTATIKANVVTNPNTSFNFGISIEGGATSTVTGNFVAGVSVGLASFGGSGSISGNTVMAANNTGIWAATDGVLVMSNKIFDTPYGISLFTSVATIQGNNIANAFVGIEFKPTSCYADPNVHSNTITDVGIGIDQVPTSVTSTNTYYNVGTIKTGGC